MGQCCSKTPVKYQQEEEEEFHEVLLDIDPGGTVTMTGGTVVARSPGRWGVTPGGPQSNNKPRITTKARVTSGRPQSPTKAKITTGRPQSPTKVKVSPRGSQSPTKTRITTGRPQSLTKTTTGRPQSPTKSKVTPRPQSPTKSRITARSGVQNTKVQGTTGVSKTYHFTSTGGRGSVGGMTVLAGSRVTTLDANVITRANNRSSFGIRPTTTPGGKSMGKKTTTETTIKNYTKDGKKFEEKVEVTTVEDDDGNVTKTTKTTTRCINQDVFSTKDMSDALEGAKKGRGRRKSSSSSSSDSSPTRTKTHKDKSATKSSDGHKSRGGLLNKFRKGGDDGSSSSDESDDEDFVKGVHKSVNEYRVKHGVAKLKLCTEVFAIVMMSKYARQWAKKLAADDKMSHRPDCKYGENVFCLSSNSKTVKVNSNEVVDRWYKESENHKFGSEPEGTLLKTGHFTQLVWKDSKKLGVGKARSADGTKIYVVANFDPQGNWRGQFADHVPPVGGFPKSASSGKISLFSGKSRKSSASSDSDSSSDEEDFAEDCLKVHNTLRKKHGAPPLKLSKKLTKHAKEWAETIAKKDVLQHRQPNNYGENLYCAWSSNPKHQIKAQEAVDSWYEEIKFFKFGQEPKDLSAGHFTQVVWLDSKELGVAVARAKSGKLYVVANYSPAGNFVGSFASKVPRPQ